MEHVFTATAVHGKQRMVTTIEVNIFESSENWKLQKLTSFLKPEWPRIGGSFELLLLLWVCIYLPEFD
jgi:hypothetical protein